MSEDFAIANIKTVLDAERLLATLMVWNRLEGQPRTRDFLRALRAEVRDPLWLLSRQWQTGEFKGDDAGSPVLAKAHLTTRPLQGYRPGDGPDQDFAPELPLEATVEKRRIPFLTQESLLSLDLRVSLGRHWLRLLRRATLDVLLPEFLGAYGIAEPDPELAADATATAHAETWQQLAALAGRVVDGGALYLYLKSDATHRASDGIANIPAGRDGDLDGLGDDLVAWFERLLLQPDQGDNGAWQPSRLEYRFAVSAPAEAGQTVLSAEEYFQGRLDWYSLDFDPAAAAIEPTPGAVPSAPPPPPQGHTLAFFPANIRFEGMPNTRWWSFEDGKTNFGDIAPDTTDLSKLLLMEFGLVYANDWFLVPFALPVGTLAKVEGIAVTNVFGERSWVQAAGSGADEDWQRWALFNLATKGEADVAADTTLALLPALAKTSEGAPLEDLYLVRDEISNMVWGIEKAIPLPSGWPKAGREAATEMAERQRQILAAAVAGGLPVPTPPEPAANIRYQLMTAVPENWIPFIPVHVPGSSRQIRLQRASMPRIIPGDPRRPPAKIKPRTTLLREGLDEATPQPLYIEEEEVSRAGERVLLAYQRTRWYRGRVVTWLGARKQVGRGEGSSGLAFDRVVPTPAQGGG